MDSRVLRQYIQDPKNVSQRSSWGKFPSWIQMNLRGEVVQCSGEEEFDNLVHLVNSIQSSADRIKFFIDHPVLHKILTKMVKEYTRKRPLVKSVVLYRAHVNDAAKKLSKGDYELSLRQFSEAVSFAPMTSNRLESLEVSYYENALAKRSEALFALGRYKEALRDLDEALTNSFLANNLTLTQRCLMCIQKIESNENRAAAVSELVETKSAPDEVSESVLQQLKEEGKTTNTQAGLNSNMEVKYTAKKGRHIVAAGRIETSSVIMNEVPFSHWLDPQEYEYFCFHCLTQLNNCPVPCRTCYVARFCSQTCADEAWNEYHEVECPKLNVLMHLDVLHLAVRTILVAGVENALSVQESEPVVEAKTEQVSNFTDKRVHYRQVYLMDDYAGKAQASNIWLFFALGAFACVLNDSTELFALNEKQLYSFGALIAKHTMQIAAHLCHITATAKSQIERHWTAHRHGNSIGVGFYPQEYLLKHGCGHDVYHIYKGRTLQLFAQRAFNQGEEIRKNYGFYFDRMTTFDRKRLLMETYLFDCDCEYCNIGRDYEGIAYKCIKCGGPFFIQGKREGYCSNCQSTDGVSSLLAKEQSARNVQQKAHKLYVGKEFANCLLHYRQLLSMYREILWPHNETMANINLYMGVCCTAMKEYTLALEHWETRYNIIKILQGQDHLLAVSCLVNMSALQLDIQHTLVAEIDRLRAWEKAKNYFKEAINIYEKIRHYDVNFFAQEDFLHDIELLDILAKHFEH